MQSGDQVVSFKPICWFNDMLLCLDFTKAGSYIDVKNMESGSSICYLYQVKASCILYIH